MHLGCRKHCFATSSYIFHQHPGIWTRIDDDNATDMRHPIGRNGDLLGSLGQKFHLPIIGSYFGSFQSSNKRIC